MIGPNNITISQFLYCLFVSCQMCLSWAFSSPVTFGIDQPRTGFISPSTFIEELSILQDGENKCPFSLASVGIM